MLNLLLTDTVAMVCRQLSLDYSDTEVNLCDISQAGVTRSILFSKKIYGHFLTMDMRDDDILGKGKSHFSSNYENHPVKEKTAQLGEKQ